MKLLRVEIRNFRLEGYDIIWDILPDVTVLVGMNGSGKTTILRLVEAMLDLHIENDATFALIESACLYFEGGGQLEIDSNAERTIVGMDSYDIPLHRIQTFDVPNQNGNGKSVLDERLMELTNDFLLFQSNLRKDIDKLYTQRQKFSDEEVKIIEQKVHFQNKQREQFRNIINEFFADSHKTLSIEESFHFIYKEELTLDVSMLSSGEKQLLLILLNVFLQNEKPSVLLLDEPEISMHVNWQRKLISKLLEINPNCQLLIATHSGSLLGRGWMDNFKRVEEVLFPYKSKPSLSGIKPIENSVENEEAKLSRIQLALDNLEGSPYQQLMDFTPIINKEHTLSFSEAKKMIVMLKTKKIQPNMITYNTLLKKMNWEDGKLFFSDMKAAFKKTNEKYLVDFVYALNLLLKKAPNLYNALSLIEEMEKENIKPDIISFSTLIGKTLTKEDIRAVEKLRIYYRIEKNATYLIKLQFKNYFE